MANNLHITINDFENICRTCLSKENLTYMYEKFSVSTSLVDMLMFCTSVKFAENEGLPVKVCTNCIHEINQAFSFVKRCETVDTILRNCVKKIKTELANNSFQSQVVEPITEIKPEIILPDVHRTAEVLQNYEFVKIKQEDELIIENESAENYDDPADESYEEDDDEDQGDTDSDKSDRPGFRPRSINFQITKDSLAKKPDQRVYIEKEKANQSLSTNFQCTECDRTYKTKRFLQEHSKIHGERKFLCNVCGRSFISKSILNTHSKSHILSYACHECGKAFNCLSSLKTHKLIHTGEKPHVCSVCSKAFTQRKCLKAHMIIHTGEKPYICGVCSKTFTQSNNLERHMRLHTGEKPFSCEVCGKSFGRKSVLITHTRSHTGEKPYICPFCGKGFYDSYPLVRHKRTHGKQN